MPACSKDLPVTEELQWRTIGCRYADLGVPRPSDLTIVLSRLSTNVDDGIPSYVHCWGGVGRTGTEISCWLVEHDALDGQEALACFAALRDGTPDAGRA
jgi:protein-tyrosine phosphatase